MIAAPARGRQAALNQRAVISGSLVAGGESAARRAVSL